MKTWILLYAIFAAASSWASVTDNMQACSNQTISEAALIKKVFKPGEGYKELAASELFVRTRSCTKLMNCSDWGNWTKLRNIKNAIYVGETITWKFTDPRENNDGQYTE